MTAPGFSDELQAALRHHREGRLREAEALYRSALSRQPDHPEALRLFGLLAKQTGNEGAAFLLLERAVASDPRSFQARLDFGHLLKARGNLDGAITAFAAAARLNPASAEGSYHLGRTLQVAGRAAEADQAFAAAMQITPVAAEGYNNRGAVLLDLGRVAEALESFTEAYRLDPKAWAAMSNAGSALLRLGRAEAAIDIYQKALAICPGAAGVWRDLAAALLKAGKPQDSAAASERALQLAPHDPGTWNNASAALLAMGGIEEAERACREALRLSPSAEALTNLGDIYKARGRWLEAVDSYRQAITLNPAYASAYVNLGSALVAMEDLDGAIEACRQVIALQPGSAMAYANLGTSFKNQGDPALALEAYRTAVKLAPDSLMHWSNLLFCLAYDPASTAASILEECRVWGRTCRNLAPSGLPRTSAVDPERKLRIGLVSGDFREHVAGYGILPFLRHRDPTQVEVFCYSNGRRVDAKTECFRTQADVWREIVLLNDDAAADLVRGDAIDILVDLSLHSDSNRLPLFARKPAPVQASYLAYAGTTGLEAMDYRLSDRFIDPPGTDDESYSEATIRLPDCYWHYEPLGPTPDVAESPAISAGRVTFGCLNNFAKASDGALELWAQILRAMPHARLLLMAPRGVCRDRVRKRLAEHEVALDRVEFVAKCSWAEYIALWNRIDIALDPFPFGGGITTCDALWMGAPVVTLTGETSVGRGATSILQHIGMPELVAKTPEEYVRIALTLADDREGMRALRSDLRSRMARSPLRDPERFARGLELAFRQMWRAWVAKQAEK